MQNNHLVAFSYQDAPLRVEIDEDGQPLFHAGDLCKILGYANPRDAVRRHAHEGDIVKRDVIDSLGRKQQVNFLREPGMWSLILGSETAAAKPVKRWVTADVLPSIRKTGEYIVPGRITTGDGRSQQLQADLTALRTELDDIKRRLDARPTQAANRKAQHDKIRDKIAAHLARRTPMFTAVEWLGRDVLHKANLSQAEREAISDGLRQMDYLYSAPHGKWRAA